MRRVVWVTVFLSIVSALAGRAADAALQVCLDFYPNPNHVPLYVAAALFSPDFEIDLIVPGNPSDPVKLVAARSVDVALTPQINYLMARSEGLPLIAIGALIDHSLGGLLSLADRGVTALEDLAGKRVGYSLAPLEPVLWTTMFACAGMDPAAVDLIPVGYNTMASLLAGTVDAIGAFRNFEPFQAEAFERSPVFFPQEAFCVPATYDLIFVVHPSALAKRPENLRRFLAGLGEAVAWTRLHPDDAFAIFADAVPELDDDLNWRSFQSTLPLYADAGWHDDAASWSEVYEYLATHGLIDERLPLSALYTDAFLPDP